MPVLNLLIIEEYSFQPNAEENNQLDTFMSEMSLHFVYSNMYYSAYMYKLLFIFGDYLKIFLYLEMRNVSFIENKIFKEGNRLPKKLEKHGEKWNLVILKSQRLPLDLHERRKQGGSGIGSQDF